MKYKLILLFVGIFFISLVSSANYWVLDPNSCPNTYQSQTCSGSDLVCGANGGITYCYDNSALTAPSPTQSTTDRDGGTCQDGTCNGGFILDCYAYDGSEPHCDNSGAFWCDRNSTLYNSPIYRQTNCTDFGTSQPGTCISGRYNCYGDTNCESTSSTDCGGISDNTHYITATCETDPTQSGSGTCEADTNYFECDGSITDADGAEFFGGLSGVGTCGSATGWYAYDECLDASTANCTAAGSRSGNRDCNNDDSDGNELTCNGANGCEIVAGATCGDSTGTYQSGVCLGSGGNCTRSSDYLDCDDDDSDGNELTCNGANGCEVDPGSACSVGGLAGTVANSCPYSCEVDPVSYGTSGVQYNWSSSSSPFLWFSQLGAGLIANFSGSTNNTFTIDTYTNVVFDGNLTLGDTITLALGEVIDNIRDGWITITGNLEVSGDLNVTGTGTFQNITLRDALICNSDGTCYTLTDLNTTGAGAGDGQGLIDTNGYYLFDNGTRVFLNETNLNSTILDIALQFNNTDAIISVNNTHTALWGQQCPSGYYQNGTLSNGTITCVEDQTGTGADGTGGWTNDSIQTNTSYNVNIQNGANLTIENGNIFIEENSTITRSGTNTSTWISETGNFITKLG